MGGRGSGWKRWQDDGSGSETALFGRYRRRRAGTRDVWLEKPPFRTMNEAQILDARSVMRFVYISIVVPLPRPSQTQEGVEQQLASNHPPLSLSPRVLPLRDSRNRFSNYLLLPSCAYCQKRVRTGLEGAWAPPPRTGGAGSRPIPWRRRLSGCARYRVRGRRVGSTKGCRYDGGIGAKSVGQRVGGRDFEGHGGGRREEVQRPTRHKTARTTTMAKSKTAHRMKNQPQNPLPSPAGGLAGSLDVGG